MARSENPSFRKLTGTQQFRVHSTILANATVEGGEVDYAEGWNDERVAAEALPDVPAEKRAALARAYRLRELGQIRPRNPSPSPHQGARDLAELAALKAWALDVSASLGIEPPRFSPQAA